jgi:hypothetical protein
MPAAPAQRIVVAVVGQVFQIPVQDDVAVWIPRLGDLHHRYAWREAA